ncbi:MAG TPA: mechanosensitive ion channel domain-containing protein [Polyangiaceae bacterium]|nr:mechanosensitive ion channel domain-containing protein [Polyangiaceae bacterium]
MPGAPPAPTPAVAVEPPQAMAPPPPLPSAAPASSASAEAAKAPEEAGAKIHDTVVFSFRRGDGGRTMAERASAAGEALARAAETSGTEEVRVVYQGDAAVVYAGPVPIAELHPEDATAAGAVSLESYASSVAARVKDAIRAEKKRSAIAGAVFSFSLLVFVGLVAFYVLRKIGEFFERVRKWMVDNPDRIKGIRIQSQEVVGATALRGGALVTLIVGRFVAQIGVVYLWLVFALSLFESTRPYTEKLTGFVVRPLSDLAGRLAASLPVAVVGVVSTVALYVLLRFVQLFFEGVARRQTVLPWLPADLAAPTSVLVRVGLVVLAMALAAPVVTGDADGTIARIGSLAVLAIAIASTPLVATTVLGALLVYGRRVRVGQHVQIGEHAGRVVGVGLLDVQLIDRDGCEVRVPHLVTLYRPTRIAGMRPRIGVDVAIAATADPKRGKTVLLDAASALGERAVVELASADATSHRYRVTVGVPSDTTPGDVRLALLEALAAASLPLGLDSPRGDR